jgi:hypothetical protein
VIDWVNIEMPHNFLDHAAYDTCSEEETHELEGVFDHELVELVKEGHYGGRDWGIVFLMTSVYVDVGVDVDDDECV